MRPLAPPFRFLLAVLGGWIGLRAAMLAPRAAIDEAIPAVAGVSPALAETARVTLRIPIAPDPPRVTDARTITRPVPDTRVPAVQLAAASPAPATSSASPLAEPRLPDLPRPGDPGPVTVPLAPSPSRWAVSAYVYAREGGGTASLAENGQLGGSQASARLTYRLNRDGPTRFALAARVSTPLASTRGAEAALGLDWHPAPRLPLRLTVERRFDVGGMGRNAWSAYAAGGFYAGRLPAGLEADGYAEGGVVGASRRDLFTDGAVRVAKRIAAGEATVRMGAGLWGAAQPHAARLDVGPRAAVTLPAGKGSVTAELDYRARLTGKARPGSGVAFTLSTDF